MSRLLGVGIVVFIVLSGCSSDGGSSSVAVDRYDPCSLLTAEQLASIAGTPVNEIGAPLSLVPGRSCTRQDVLSSTDYTVRVGYDVMNAARWVAALHAEFSTAPDATEPLSVLQDVMAEAGLTEDDLPSLDDSTACDVWNRYGAGQGGSRRDGIFVSVDDSDDLGGFAIARGCQGGNYASITLETVDVATDPDRLDEMENGVRLLLDVADQVPSEP